VTAETEFVSVYMTAASQQAAEALGRNLVEERLAACVNVLPGGVSIYRWKGAVQRDEEVVLLAKTRRSRVEALTSRVHELHADDVPCVLVLPITGGSPAYLAWLAEQTAEE
jgi:periplasmic divalent cation tolerance protein